MSSCNIKLFGKVIGNFSSEPACSSCDTAVQASNSTVRKVAFDSGKGDDPSLTLLKGHEPPMEHQRPIDEPEDAEKSPNKLSPSRLARDARIPCPRCNSLDTRFCYFNNYDPDQPRHFCKACQRFWTNGGSMRDLPVGSGRRKRRHKSSTNKRKMETESGNPQGSLSPQSSMATIAYLSGTDEIDLMSLSPEEHSNIFPGPPRCVPLGG